RGHARPYLRLDRDSCAASHGHALIMSRSRRVVQASYISLIVDRSSPAGDERTDRSHVSGPKRSAGLLLYRTGDGQLDVLIAHMGGPFWANKDEGAWSIIKGEHDEHEDAY